MKLLLRCFSTLVIPLFLIASSCGKDSPEVVPETESVKELLMGKWNLTNVLVDGSTTDVYQGLSLTFTGTTITSVNGEPVWPASDTWNFVDDTAKAIRRGDGQIIDIISISQAQLTLGLTWSKTTIGGNRALSIAGKHVFTFNR